MKVLAIVGPTASSKSNIAVEVAKRVSAEIVSADSMQIYESMDIGTAKPDKNIREEFNHHMIDITPIGKPFDVVKYQSLAREAISKIIEKKKLPILVGGTGLYVKSVLYDLRFPEEATDTKLRLELEKELREKGIGSLQEKLKKEDSVAYETIDIENGRRVIRALEATKALGRPFSSLKQDLDELDPYYDFLIVGLDMPREVLYERINKRVDSMISKGLIEETRTLLKSGLGENPVAGQAIGYKEISEYLDGAMSIDEAIRNLKKRTRNYAKRQYTWFRKDKRINWLDVNDKTTVEVGASIIRLLD